MIYETISKDLITAMKSSDKKTVSALKVLIPEIRNLELIQKKEINNENVVSVINKTVKQRINSIEMYIKAGRTDLADKDKEEVEIISRYLPKMMTVEEINVVVRENMLINNIQFKEQKQQLVKIVMPILKGKANGKDVMGVIDGVFN